MKHTTKKLLSLLLVLSMLAGLFAFTGTAAPADGAAITDLKVNNLTQPLGVDTTPVFRWLVTLDGYGRSQSAYQIIVASTAEKAAAHQGDLWDSGKVTGSDNFNVVYGGAALTSRTPYYWTVQLWDETDTSIGWSDVTFFETGILDPSEWTAQWITSKQGTPASVECDLNSANWIWSRYGQAQDAVPAETMYFRGSFTVDAGKTVQQAVLGFTTDDYGSVYINGEKAGEVFNVSNAWQGGCAADITDLVKTGVNTVAADVTNGDVGYAGFIGKIIVSYTDGSTDTTVTDGSWRLTKSPAAGWQAEAYDDSAWETPDQVLVYGSSPWGTQVNLKTKSEDAETFSAPMLRKGFTVEKQVLRARAYVSGLGLFELKLNGQLPDDSVLNPAHTQYEDTVNYRVFDVTELVQQGENVLAAEVGNSFYNCLIQTWSWPSAVWRDDSKFMMELVLEYTDGTRETIVTDPTWKAYSKGPITANDIYLGETYDARLEVQGWDRAGFDDSGWDAAILEDAPAGKLTFENMEPMRRVQSFTPAVTDKGSGTYILENPVMATGWARIAFDAPAGTEIKITYGETVNGSGYLNMVSMEGYTFQQDTYICKGVAGETYEPKFSYKGYRYIQVDGYPGTLTADDVTCYLIANDVDIIGSVDTSREMINTLHTIMQRTMRNNMQGKPTDTPVWEKNGWTGDFNVSQRSFNYNFDTAAFTNKFQGDLRDSADSRGVVPDISPTANWGMENAPVWNTVYINSLYEGWKSNGQLAQIEEHYDAMRKQTNAYISDIRSNGWVWRDDQLADWVAPDGNASASEGSGICGTAYVYRALEQMAEIADELGKTEDAAEYRAAMEKIYAAFNAKFYNAQKGYYETTVWNDGTGLRTRFRQTSQLVPLAFGLCPEEYRESVVASLVDHIVNVKATHLDTGMVGTQLILPVLSQQGNADLALSILTQTTYPSWGYWLSRNSTSTWEGYGDDARSRNHYFLGTYEEWIFAYLGGIRDMTNGYETVVIDPYVNNQLTYSNISVDTIRGKLQSNWSLGENVNMEIIVPTGTTAYIYLPAASADGVTVNGAALADQPGITAVTMENGKVKATAGSGTYAFVMGTESIAASKAELRKVVGEAKRMNEDSYPEGAWTRLTAALAEAENVLTNANATQAEVDAAAAALDTVLEETARYRMGNLALGQLVTVSSTVDQGSGKSWDQSFLTDGVTTAASLTDQTPGWTSNDLIEEDHSEFAMVDLGRTYQVSRVELYPAGQKGTVGSVSYGFPKDFTIEVSTDGTDWTPVVTETGYAAPVVETEGVNPVQVFAFDEVSARYIRVRATSLNQLLHDNNLYRMQLAEIEVYNGVVDKTGLKALLARAGEAEEILYPADLWNRLQEAVAEASAVLHNDQATKDEVDEAAAVLSGILDEMAAFQVENLALNKPVTVSSSLDQSVGTSWHQKNLTDGDRKNLNQYGQFGGWTSNDSIEESHEEWAQVDLEQVYDITRVDLYPAGYSPTARAVIYGFPKDFVIEVSVDGENWETALTVTDYPTLTVAKDNVPPVQRFTLDRINARYVRIRATALHALVNDGNTYRMQLGEIEVYSYPETDAERAAAVDAKIRAIGEVTLDSKAAIDEARQAYEALNDAQKALVTELPTLEAAEAAYQALLGKPVQLLVTGEAEATAQAESVRYTISAADMSRLATVKLTVALDPETLTDPIVTGAGDWFVIVQTYENGVLTVVAANKAGADGTGDLLTILAKPTGKAGTATAAITNAELCVYDGEGEKFVQADLTQASATTNLILNIYDVNRDGVVDLLDVARAQRHYGTDDAICDVNQDGEVNIADLIMILNNFTVAF